MNPCLVPGRGCLVSERPCGTAAFSPIQVKKAHVPQTPHSASQGVWGLVRRFTRCPDPDHTRCALACVAVGHQAKVPLRAPFAQQMVHVAAPRAADGKMPHQDFDLKVGIPVGHCAVALASAGVVGFGEPDACGP